MTQRQARFATLALLAATTACTSPGVIPTTPVAELPGAQSVGVAALQHPVVLFDLTVNPVELIEDSRCPVDTQCVWAGRVVIDVDLTEGDIVRRIQMISGEPVPAGSGQLEFSDVLSAKEAGQTTPPDLMRFEFTYTIK